MKENIYTPRELDIMATYIVEASERENRETERRREILTQNRLQTIQKKV